MAISKSIGEFLRKTLQTVLPQNISEDMEKESKTWMAQCRNCKYERSVWDMGGIRWKAAGNPIVYRYCINCRQKNWHQIYRKANI